MGSRHEKCNLYVLYSFACNVLTLINHFVRWLAFIVRVWLADAHKTAVVFIEYQNEFATEGGKLHEAVKGTMGGMLGSSAAVADAARAAGATVMHAPITFNEDASDNPNKGVGILAGCAENKFFTEGTRKLG